MKREAYETIPDKNHTVFKFESTGKKGSITKVVMFYHEFGDTWSLGFGDQRDDLDFDDRVITNNHDLQKVIQTVANTVYDFLEVHPGSNILIEGVDARRKSLYNSIFKRKWEEIRTRFTVFAVKDGNLQSYSPKNDYDLFVVSKKWGNFEEPDK